ncbi:MAG TPA: DUF5682 family protein [Chloroflexia bacterium]|nr:DUF5682 family protein [Chloroflexia bacterium]
MSQPDDIHIFGIRHHGPGSARSLRSALEELQPDILLVEGPPDAAALLSLMLDSEMTPPVALLIYRPDQPNQAVYYPFAVFSPEWQALHFGQSQNIPVRFMDLPVKQRFALKSAQASTDVTPEEKPEEKVTPEETGSVDITQEQEVVIPNPRADPLGWLAQAAGFSDGERWWEQMVEQRHDSQDLFQAILEAMTVLRESAESNQLPGEEGYKAPDVASKEEAYIENLREASMRQNIRQARREGFKRIAVVCGAWHGPALTEAALKEAKQDAALLKNLPSAKVEATWIPWTYGRLSYFSGYGAGVSSPGWYHHLWTHPENTVIRWMSQVASLLREQDMQVSSAHLIEAVRLSEALASLRNHPLPGLPEVQEAIQTILCYGETLPMQLIHDKLVVGERMGQVPETTPMVPLQLDLQRQQKRLRLIPDATVKELDLDLRKPNDLDRSYLLHRLNLLEINWGRMGHVSGKSGTFHETWRIKWEPEFAVQLIEKGVWGNTIGEAATGYTRHLCAELKALPELTKLVERVLLADLPEAIEQLMQRLQNEAALTSDIGHLMDALPALANVLRYGSVRQMKLEVVEQVVDGLVARISIGLPGACTSLNDEAAGKMFKSMLGVNQAIGLLQKRELLDSWYAALVRLADREDLHGLLAGGCCRLLLDAGRLESEEVTRRLGLALSSAVEPAHAAAWVEGLLQESGLLLIHDDKLWQVLDHWVSNLDGPAFVTLLPLLRRTFSTFSQAERRQLGEKARNGKAGMLRPDFSAGQKRFDYARADKSLEVVATLLGIA